MLLHDVNGDVKINLFKSVTFSLSFYLSIRVVSFLGMGDHDSQQLPAFCCAHQYFLLSDPPPMSLRYFFYYPFTQIYQVGFPPFSCFSCLLCVLWALNFTSILSTLCPWKFLVVFNSFCLFLDSLSFLFPSEFLHLLLTQFMIFSTLKLLGFFFHLSKLHR